MHWNIPAVGCCARKCTVFSFTFTHKSSPCGGGLDNSITETVLFPLSESTVLHTQEIKVALG